MALINLLINGLPINSVNGLIPRLIPTPQPTEQLQVTDILNIVRPCKAEKKAYAYNMQPPRV